MERITYLDAGKWRMRIMDVEYSGKDVDRIASVENIFGDNYDLTRLRHLVEADRDGRCVVLPKDGMVYYIEEVGGEKWVANKPIQQITVKCGWGLASLEFSLFDTGKHFSREAAEAALEKSTDM